MRWSLNNVLRKCMHSVHHIATIYNTLNTMHDSSYMWVLYIVLIECNLLVWHLIVTASDDPSVIATLLLRGYDLQ